MLRVLFKSLTPACTRSDALVEKREITVHNASGACFEFTPKDHDTTN